MQKPNTSNQSERAMRISRRGAFLASPGFWPLRGWALRAVASFGRALRAVPSADASPFGLRTHLRHYFVSRSHASFRLRLHSACSLTTARILFVKPLHGRCAPCGFTPQLPRLLLAALVAGQRTACTLFFFEKAPL